MSKKKKQELPYFRCPVCERVSYHPKDIEYRYCGHCHYFIGDLVTAQLPPYKPEEEE
jgi:hypothetical protein